jgi:hypothetical protein
MKFDIMTVSQQSPSWRLAPGQALRLPAVGRERWLRVVDGEVWLTVSSTSAEPSEDTWLASGAQSLLPAGREAVLEGHPHATFHLLEPAAAAGRAPALRGWGAHQWLQRLSLEPGPAC